MCGTRLAVNTGRKNRHFGTIAQLCRAVSSQLRHVSTIGKKLVKQRYLLHVLAGRPSRWALAHILVANVWWPLVICYQLTQSKHHLLMLSRTVTICGRVELHKATASTPVIYKYKYKYKYVLIIW